MLRILWLIFLSIHRRCCTFPRDNYRSETARVLGRVKPSCKVNTTALWCVTCDATPLWPRGRLFYLYAAVYVGKRTNGAHALSRLRPNCITSRVRPLSFTCAGGHSRFTCTKLLRWTAIGGNEVEAVGRVCGRCSTIRWPSQDIIWKDGKILKIPINWFDKLKDQIGYSIYSIKYEGLEFFLNIKTVDKYANYYLG